MKNIFVAIYLFLSIQSAFPQQTIPLKTQVLENVGDIIYDSSIDKPLSFLRSDNRIFWYYSVNATYKGGKKNLLKCILAQYKYRATFKGSTGYVTIKFVINNVGETDRFRINQLNNDYKQTTFPPALTEGLKKIVMELKDWLPGRLPNGTTCNSYYYLNFKIDKGKIKELTP